MAEKVLILSTYLSDKAVVVPSSEISSLPAVNVLNQDPSKVWRTANGTGQYLNFILPNVEEVNCVAFTWPFDTLSSSALARVKVYLTADDMTADVDAVIDTDWVSVWPLNTKHSDPDWGPEVGLVRWENQEAYRYVKVMFTDPSPSTLYLDIARIAIGKEIQFVTNPTHDGGIGFVPLDLQEPNGYGQVFTDPRPFQQRRFELVWMALAGKAVREDAMSLARLRGQAGDFFVFINPAAAADEFHILSMQGVFENQHSFSPTPVYMPDKDGENRKGWSFTIAVIQKL